MGSMKNNQKGFGAVEGLLILIIVLIVGFIGYYVYSTKQSSDKTLTTNSVKTTPNSAKSVTTATKTTHTGQDAVTFTQATYDNFLAALNKANSDSTNTKSVAQVGLAAIKDHISADLYAQASAVTQATPFTCTAQYVTDKYTATLKSTDPTSAVVAISISNGDGSSTSGMAATVDLTSLKITSVSCPS
jgi:hypothetical protein